MASDLIERLDALYSDGGQVANHDFRELLIASYPQLRSQIATAHAAGRAAGLKEAAQECDEWAQAVENTTPKNTEQIFAYLSAAAAIRALEPNEWDEVT